MDGERYACNGARVWAGSEDARECGQPLFTTLLNSTNAYFSKTTSSLYIPKWNDRAKNEVTEILRRPKFTTARMLITSDDDVPEKVDLIRTIDRHALQKYGDADIVAAFLEIADLAKPTPTGPPVVASDDEEVAYRREEFAVLTHDRQDHNLDISVRASTSYGEPVRGVFSSISLVRRLKETRALLGFQRYDSSLNDPEALRSLLWADAQGDWLPAVEVFGEGLLFVLNSDRVARWLDENHEQLAERVAVLTRSLETSYLRELGFPITPRLLLAHSLSHMLIGQLTFHCGYSSAALKERLYVSDDHDEPMSAFLIYTAAGDADGTLGGLVRMGQPGNLEEVFAAALHRADWCSSDPVCMEAARIGQGPDRLNLAACHNCLLLPETSCETFNRLLDRGVVVGWGNTGSGFLFQT